jgi:hypothetical protein
MLEGGFIMNEVDRKKRNQTKLSECYPKFAQSVTNILTELESQGLRPRIQEAWRSPADQLAAYNSGHSKLKYGFHNVTDKNGKPESLAVDILDDDAPLNPSNRFLLMLAAFARKYGLQTGILWGLTSALSNGVDQAINTGNFDANVKIGWDPCHVEAIGITPTQAKAGARP